MLFVNLWYGIKVAALLATVFIIVIGFLISLKPKYEKVEIDEEWAKDLFYTVNRETSGAKIVNLYKKTRFGKKRVSKSMVCSTLWSVSYDIKIKAKKDEIPWIL